MKKIRMEKQIKCSADSLWELFADVTRSDWVPFAKEIVFNVYDAKKINYGFWFY